MEKETIRAKRAEQDLIDNKVNNETFKALMNGIIKQPGVDTYNDTSGGKTSLLSQYPSPQKGWDVLVRKENTRYNWNGSVWVNIEAGNYSEDVATLDDVYRIGYSLNSKPIIPLLKTTYSIAYSDVIWCTDFNVNEVQGIEIRAKKGAVRAYKCNIVTGDSVLIKEVQADVEGAVLRMPFDDIVILGINERIGVSGSVLYSDDQSKGLLPIIYQVRPNSKEVLQKTDICLAYSLITRFDNVTKINQDIRDLGGMIRNIVADEYVRATRDLTRANYDRIVGGRNPYFNKYNADTRRLVKEVVVFSTDTDFIELFKIDKDYKKVTSFGMFPVKRTTTPQFLKLEKVLEIGELVGVRGAIRLTIEPPMVGTIGNINDGLGWTDIDVELAYSLIQTPDYRGDEPKEPEPIVIPKTKKNYVQLINEIPKNNRDNFEIVGNWNTTNGLRPNAMGDTTYIRHKKTYHSDDRYMRATVNMGIDTFLRIPVSWHYDKNSVNDGEGASCFGVDFKNKKLLIYEVGNGKDNQLSSSGYTDTILKSATIPDDMVGNMDVVIELRKEDTKHLFTLCNYKTGKTVSVEHDGWGAGRQNQHYAFFLESGTAFTLKNMSVYSLDKPDVVFVGDSITEGVWVLDRTKRYVSLYRKQYPEKNIVISARGGANIDNVLEKFESEYNIYRPKMMSVLIGANAGNTLEKLKQLKAKCDAIGCTLILNYRNCQGDNNAHIAGNELIAQLGLPGARFDIATAIDNDPTKGLNPIYYGDKMHPNEESNAELFKRLFVDVPELN